MIGVRGGNKDSGIACCLKALPNPENNAVPACLHTYLPLPPKNHKSLSVSDALCTVLVAAASVYAKMPTDCYYCADAVLMLLMLLMLLIALLLPLPYAKCLAAATPQHNKS